MKTNLHNLKRAFFAMIMLLGVGVTAWGETVTIQAGSSAAGSEFSYSSLGVYSYSDDYWAKKNNSTVIAISSGNSFTFTNVNGATINSIVVKGVAQNNSVKSSTVSISDGENSISTGTVTWAGRQNTESNITSQTLTGVENLKMTKGTVYTVSNSGYNLGIQIEIDYTKGTGGDDCTPLAVNFAAGEGTGSMDADECCPEKTYTIPACTFTAPDGKEFDAWTSSDVTITDGKFTMPSSAVTLTATWKDAVTVVPATGVSIEVSATKVKVGETITITATVLPANATDKSVTWSCETNGIWSYSAGNPTTATALVPTSSNSGKKIYATTSNDIKSSGKAVAVYAEISFETNGGDAIAPMECYTSNITLPTPVKAGSTFVQWCSDAELTTKVGDSKLAYKSSTNIKLYAKWQEIVKKQVTFVAGDGTGSMDAEEVEVGTVYTIPACTFTAPDGKEFDAWTSEDVTITDGKFTMPNQNVTLTATWKDEEFSSEKKLTQVVFSNSFDAFINETNKTVTAYYLEGTTAPTVASMAQSAEATATVDGNTITVTAENGSTQDYTISLAEVTPAEFGEYTFDGNESWVKAPQGFEASKGWKFAKNADDGRVQEGKTRQYYFVAACEKFVLHTASGISSDRNIFVYVNGVKVDAITKAPKYNAAGSYIEIPCDKEKAVVVAIVSNQTGGDGGFGKAEVKAYKVTCPASVAITGTNAYGFGETIELTATQTGSNTPENVNYQWYKDEVAIDGATANVFTKADAAAEDAGSYVCKVNQGECDEVASEAYAITVSAIEATSFTIASDLGDLKEIKAGTTFQVTVTITPANTTDKTVAWRSELTSGNPYFTMTEGNPTTVTAVLPCSSAKKVYAKVGSLSEKNVSVKVYYEVEFANCDAIEPMKYYGNGIDLPTPTGGNEPFVGWYDNAEFTGSAIKLTGYKPEGNVTLYAKWTMPDAETPTITTQPQSANYEAGAVVAPLTVEASVTVGALSYQWYKGTTVIAGATEASYTPEVSGEYKVVVTNTLADHNPASATSEVATITIAKAVLEQVDVTASTTWDWTNAADAEVKTDMNNIVLANVDGVKNNAEFNSQALLVGKGSYAYRTSSCAKACFQGSKISFNTTVAGLVTVEFSNTGNSAARTVKINNTIGENSSEGTAAAAITTVTVPVMAGEVVIAGVQVSDEATKDVRIYSIEFQAADYSRNLNGKMGTHCYPFSIQPGNYYGASFYQIAYRLGDSRIYWDEVAEDKAIEAGVPYLVVPNEDAAGLIAFTETSSEPAKTVNGFVGSYTQEEIAANAGNYIVYNNEFRLAGEYVAVGANRAYIHLENVTDNAVSEVPGRRRITMNNAEANTTTGLENVNGNVNVNKMLINGQLYIVREGKMYNVQGTVVK